MTLGPIGGSSESFLTQKPQELTSYLTIDGKFYSFTVKTSLVVKNARFPQKQWKIDVTCGNTTKSVTLQELRENKAVIGINLKPVFHRQNEQLIDFTDTLDQETAEAVKKLGESILLTVEQTGLRLSWEIDEAQDVQRKDA